MLATVADTARDVGTVCAALAATVGFVALVFKLRPVRWVFRKLVADPLAGWFRGLVREEIDRKNGGSTLKDTVDRLVETTGPRLARIEKALDIPHQEERPA